MLRRICVCNTVLQGVATAYLGTSFFTSQRYDSSPTYLDQHGCISTMVEGRRVFAGGDRVVSTYPRPGVLFSIIPNQLSECLNQSRPGLQLSLLRCARTNCGLDLSRQGSCRRLLVPTPFVWYRNVVLLAIATRYLISFTTARGVATSKQIWDFVVWVCVSLSPSF